MTLIFLLGTSLGFCFGYVLASMFLSGKVRQAEADLEDLEEFEEFEEAAYDILRSRRTN